MALSLMYLPLIPALAETQPIFLLMLGVFFLVVGKVAVNYFFVSFIYFFLMSVVAILLLQFERELVQELFKLLLVLLLAFLLYNSLGYGSKWFYNFFILIHVSIAILTLLGLGDWLYFIFPRYVSFEGGRGLSYLSSEPSYAATYIFFITLVYTLGLNQRYFNSRMTQLFLMGILLSTFSLISFFYFLIVTLISLSNVSTKKKIYVTLIAGASIVGFMFSVERFANELFPLIESVFSQDQDKQELAINYPSASTRVILNSIAILDGLDRVFFLAEGAYSQTLPDLLDRYGLEQILTQHEVIGALYNEGANLKPQALFPYVVYVFGILSLPFIFYPLYVLAKTFSSKRYLLFIAGIFILFLFYFYQSQYVNPIQLFAFIIIEKFVVATRRAAR